MFKQESSVRRVLPAVADTLYGLEMMKSPVFMSLRDAWFLSWWKFPKVGVAAISTMIDILRNCWFTFPTGVKLHFLQCYELRGVWWFGVWRCEGRNGERKVRDPGENGENNKNTFGMPYWTVLSLENLYRMLIIVRSYDSFLEVRHRLQHSTFHIMTSNHQLTYHHAHKLTRTFVWIAFLYSFHICLMNSPITARVAAGDQ